MQNSSVRILNISKRDNYINEEEMGFEGPGHSIDPGC
jgi:hypothetical protein